jgi:hypothetical protein
VADDIFPELHGAKLYSANMHLYDIGHAAE